MLTFLVTIPLVPRSVLGLFFFYALLFFFFFFLCAFFWAALWHVSLFSPLYRKTIEPVSKKKKRKTHTTSPPKVTTPRSPLATVPFCSSCYFLLSSLRFVPASFFYLFSPLQPVTFQSPPVATVVNGSILDCFPPRSTQPPPPSTSSPMATPWKITL